MTYQAKWVSSIFKPFSLLYAHIHNFTAARGKIGTFLVREHLLLFIFAILGIILLSPRYIMWGLYLFQKHILQLAVLKADISLPYTPTILALIIGLFFATYFLKRNARCVVLGAISIPLIFSYKFDLLSLGIFFTFLVITFCLIKLPVRRSVAVILVCSLSVGLVAFLFNWNGMSTGIIGRLAYGMVTFTPMLWYSVYQEIPPKRRLPAFRYFIYNFTRVFDNPVITYNDLFDSPDNLLKVRFAGIKALYVVTFSVATVWIVGRIANLIDRSQLTGLSLLLFSYLIYVSKSCTFVITINTFIGALRLFGIPVRDNFNYWLLAKTPNEHWRRWNLLFREWVITFVFFPIMRAKRWLFVAVMAALLTSGTLHIIPRFFEVNINWFRIANIMIYWAINGIAIYVVIKVPLLFPGMVERLKLKTSTTWSAIGIILTSAFYAILFEIRSCSNWTEIADYFSRLFSS